VVILALFAWIIGFVPWRPQSWSWAIAPWVVAGCILLTTLPISRFDDSGWLFGPDTSVGLLPLGHVFGFYAIFFVFGIGYYLADDQQGKLGRSWPWLLPISFLVIFPLALELTGGMLGWRDSILGKQWQRPAAVLGQSIFAWTASLGCIGLFRCCLSREYPWVRYMSDASYWLYLTHLPLVVWLQMAVSPSPWPACTHHIHGHDCAAFSDLPWCRKIDLDRSVPEWATHFTSGYNRLRKNCRAATGFLVE
jgi:hypothetical protein